MYSVVPIVTSWYTPNERCMDYLSAFLLAHRIICNVRLPIRTFPPNRRNTNLISDNRTCDLSRIVINMITHLGLIHVILSQANRIDLFS